MGRESKKKRARYQTAAEIFETYREEMGRTLGLEETTPNRFSNVEFVEYFERKVERLETLIALYADLLLAFRAGS